MESKKKREIEVKEEPEETSVVKKYSFLYVDEALNVKQEPEIHIQEELPEPSIIHERVQTEDQDQSVTKSNEKRFQCEKCLKCFTKKGNLKRHRKLHEDERDSCDCDQCSKSSDTRQKLSVHTIAHQERSDKSEQLFRSTRDLTCHQKAPKVFECTVCSRKFNQKGNLKSHMTVHQKGRELFSCELCESTFMFQKSLDLHTIRQHTQVETKFYCNHCPKSFKHKHLLNNHARNHKTEICKMCNKEMSRRSMRSHMKNIHGGHQNLKCPFCLKIYKNKIYLKEHLGTHEKKFKCNICEKKFPKQSLLTTHLMWHENPDIFSCQPCGKSFQTKSILLVHNRVYHQGSEKIAYDEVKNKEVLLQN